MIGGQGENLVFLLSMPRSGSTLLSLMLGNHSEVSSPPEPWILLAVAEYLDLADVRATPYGRDLAEIAALEFLLGAERKQRGALAGVLRAVGTVSGLEPRFAAKQILHAAYQTHLDVSGKRVFVDKTPRYYAALGLLDEIFFQAKKIVLLRNPLDIFASYKSTWEISRDIFSPKGVSVHTRDFCEGLFVFADYISSPREDVFVLSYEELVSGTETMLRAVCEFIGIPFSPSMLTYYENVELIEVYRRSPVGDSISSSKPRPANSRTVNAWQERLDLEDIQSCVDVMGVQIFKQLGYDETATTLRGLSLTIPAEEQAFERRSILMRTLVDTVQEQPFSTWDNFVAPLKRSESDRAARLEVIQRQQDELAAQTEVIQRQQDELEKARSFSGFIGYRFKSLIDLTDERRNIMMQKAGPENAPLRMSLDKDITFEKFLNATQRSEEGYLLISKHRKFQHDEHSYDDQYMISPNDYVAGQGLMKLVKSLALNLENPVLELGCGTGRLSVGLLKAFHPSKVLVTDASSIFLDISKKKFLENGLDAPNLAVLLFEDIDLLPDNTFSLIVIRSALHHVEKYDEFLIAASKKLVHRGALIFQEPLYEGLFILGMIAKYLQKLTNAKDILKDLMLLSDTMRFYCRTDVDKSTAEDKYAFRLTDILNVANVAGLGVRFFPNRSFEDFAGEPSQFEYAKFAESYLKYCMSFSDKTVTFFMSNASGVLEYIAEISGNDRAPESSGVFVLTRPA